MRKIMVRLIMFYQKRISPLNPGQCRHKPTCSAYAKEAYQRFNFFYASFLTIKRVLTCNPLFKPKYDPLPEKKERNVKKTH